MLVAPNNRYTGRDGCLNSLKGFARTRSGGVVYIATRTRGKGGVGCCARTHAGWCFKKTCIVVLSMLLSVLPCEI